MPPGAASPAPGAKLPDAAPALPPLAPPPSMERQRLLAAVMLVAGLIGMAAAVIGIISLLANSAQPPLATQPVAAMPTGHVQPTGASTRVFENPTKEAIARGVVYLRGDLEDLLKSTEQPGGLLGNNYEGLVALEGWTLLCCGVAADDPLIQKTAVTLRERLKRTYRTYSCALAILFFDRLKNTDDKGVIQTLAMRLVAGQHPAGNWGDDSFLLSDDDEKQLLAYLGTLDYRKSGNEEGDVQLKPGATMELSPELRKAGVAARLKDKNFAGSAGDNTNSQYAMLGLWTAKQYGLPVGPSLALVDRFYRSTQGPDGSWGHRSTAEGALQNRASMTCSGLLGLAVARGLGIVPVEDQTVAIGEAPRDRVLAKGLSYLATTVNPKERAPNSPGKYFGADADGDLAYLAALSRTGTIFGLNVIGGQEWRSWAINTILYNQNKDGNWKDTWGRADTCLALQVLLGVDAAPGLTTAIAGQIHRLDLRQAGNIPK